MPDRRCEFFPNEEKTVHASAPESDQPVSSVISLSPSLNDQFALEGQLLFDGQDRHADEGLVVSAKTLGNCDAKSLEKAPRQSDVSVRRFLMVPVME